MKNIEKFWREDELSMLEFNLLPEKEKKYYIDFISQLSFELLSPVDKFILKTRDFKPTNIFEFEVEE